MATTLVYGPGEVFRFDNPIFNVGGAYDPATGIVTCPISGYYSFSGVFFNANTQHAYMSVRHSGYELIRMTFANDWYHSFHVVIACQESETFYVECDGSFQLVAGPHHIISGHIIRDGL